MKKGVAGGGGYKRDYYLKNRERVLAQRKKYRSSTKGRASLKKYREGPRGKANYAKWARSEKGKEWKRKYYVKYHKPHRLLKSYNMTVADYEAMRARQGGLCAICGSREAVYVDHSHKTGIVRGLLCRLCNLGLGIFDDNTEFMAKAIEYLNKARQ